jgi:hypothetical protein
VQIDIDRDRIGEAVLALLWLNLDSASMAWKGFELQTMERLHRRGLISNPVGKAKSVQLSEEGLIKGECGLELRLLNPELSHSPPDGSHFHFHCGCIADSRGQKIGRALCPCLGPPRRVGLRHGRQGRWW